MTTILTYAGAQGVRGQQAESAIREHLARIPESSQRTAIVDNEIDKLVATLNAVGHTVSRDHAAFVIAQGGEHGGVLARLAHVCNGDPTMILSAVCGAIALNGSTTEAQFFALQNAWSTAHAALQAHTAVKKP